MIGLNINLYNKISYFNIQPQILPHIMNHSFKGKVNYNKLFTEKQSS